MERYINFGGDADIIAFDVDADSIRVEFSNGDICLYTGKSVGIENIREMISLAIEGGSLSQFILNHVKSRCDMRIREYSKQQSQRSSLSITR